jgi:hypothetical protein
LGLVGAVETSAKDGNLSLEDAFYTVTCNAYDLKRELHDNPKPYEQA